MSKQRITVKSTEKEKSHTTKELTLNMGHLHR